MRNLLPELQALQRNHAAVGRAVVVSVWGSAPQPPGATLVATADGQMAGSVSGGCVETAVVEEIGTAITSGASRIVEYGVADETAWSVGLACGGTLRVLVEPEVPPPLQEALEREEETVWARLVAATGEVGPGVLVRANGSVQEETPGAFSEQRRARIATAALGALRTGRSGIAELSAEDGQFSVFLEVHPRPITITVIGGVHIAKALVPLAHVLGYRTVVADGRASFVTPERFPEADALVHGWPNEVFARYPPDHSTAVCVLTHDPKFDDPALEIVLPSPAFYVGALGSAKTQAARRTRLLAAGLTEEHLEKLHGPIGLNLGGRSAEEIALAIVAEIVAARRGVASPLR